MGWELMHLFSYQDGRGYGSQISSELRLRDVCRVGDALTYTYDFSDNWQHRVTVEKTMARPKARRRELVEWLGGPFNPKTFDMDEARERLAEYVAASG